MKSFRLPSSLRLRLMMFVLAGFLLSALIAVFASLGLRWLLWSGGDPSLVHTFVLLGFVGVFVLAVAWWGIGVLILRPVQALIGITGRLSRGDLGARAEFSVNDAEFAQLGQALDGLAAAHERREAVWRGAEAQLQESESRWRQLVEFSPGAILVCTGSEIGFANAAGALLLGITDPTLLEGRRLEDFIEPGAQTATPERLPASDSGQQASRTESRLKRSDGSTFEVEILTSPLVYHGQLVTQIVFRDITERKRAEAALRESEERFRTMADDAPVLIWVAGSDALRTFFNKPWLDFTGRTLAQEQGMGWTDGLHPGDYQRYLDIYTSAFKARQSFESEYRLRRADGTYRWMVNIGVPRFTPDNQLAGYIGTCLDITERHETEEALRLSRDQFAIILQGAADGVTAQDAMGRLRYANDAAARMFGYPSAGALLAVPWPQVLEQFEILDEAERPFPSDRLPGELALQGVLKSSATVHLRPVSPADERWLTIKSTPVFNTREQVELAVNIFQDITELKHAGTSQRLLAEAGRLLATPVDNASRLADVAHLAVPVLADWCAMDVVGDDGALQRVAVGSTEAALAAMAGGHPFELDTPHGAAHVMRTGEPELYPFIPASLLDSVARDEAHGRILHELDIKSAMVVPLMARRKPTGALTFVWVESRRRYNRADLALAEELARRVALALDNVRLYDEAQKLNATLEQRVNTRTAQLLASNARLEREVAERKEAQRQVEESQAQLRRLSAHLQAAREEERIRIAREIHDELGQALAGLKMDVAWLQRTLNRPAPAISPKLEDMSALIDATVQAVRRIAAELRPSLLDDLGLAAAIEWQLDEFRERTGLECGFTSNLRTAALDADGATALFRIFQEALTNVARHAHATRVAVKLDEGPESLTLCIQDNGRGISEEEMRQAKSFGLLGCASASFCWRAKSTSRAHPARALWSPFEFRSRGSCLHDQGVDRRRPCGGAAGLEADSGRNLRHRCG